MNALIPVKLPKSGLMPRDLVVCKYNGQPLRVIPIADVQAVFISDQKLDHNDPNRLSFQNLMVRFEGDTDDARGSYASYRSRWDEAAGVWHMTALYNSHGGYDYARISK